METTILGQTGLTVSRLGFGGAPAGLTNYLDPYSPDDRDQRRLVIEAIEVALDLGITYFDTAADYGDGASERIFGEALDGAGDGVVLATKISNRMAVRASIERSLRHLRRDRIDIIQFHGDVYNQENAEQILAPGGLLEQALALRDEGVVRFIGFTSEAHNGVVERFIKDGRFDTIQVAYNLLHQHAYEPTRPFGNLFDAEAAGMGIITMRSLTSGLFQKWVQMANPANDFDYTPALLQFVFSNPLVDVALVGMRTPDEVRANVAICEDVTGRMNIDEIHGKYV